MDVSQSDIDALLSGGDATSEPQSGSTSTGSTATAVATMPTATPSAQLAHGSIDRILPIDVSVRVIIAECMLPVSTIMEFNVGSILEFAKAADAELQLMVVNQCIGLGHAVKVGENFGLQISSIGLVDDRIHGLVG